MPVLAMYDSRASWPYFPSGEYSFDHVVLVKWRLPDFPVLLQLRDTSLSFSCQSLLISRSFSLPTPLVVISFDRTCRPLSYHSLLLDPRYSHVSFTASIEPWLSCHYWHSLPSWAYSLSPNTSKTSRTTDFRLEFRSSQGLKVSD
jgi:hypothetical protein